MPPTTPRPVSFSTFWSLLKERGPFALLGLAFVLGPLLVLQSALREPYEKYDYEAITRDGTVTTARITGIVPVNNVTVNGEHPRLITYMHSGSGGQGQTDRFQTFDTKRTAALRAGDQVGIKVLRNESVIPSLKPFGFPFGLFFILPGIFILIGLVPALRKYRLYRYGLAQKAAVLGITERPVRMSLFNAVQSFVVNYEYAVLHRARLLGEDRSDDVLFVNERKLGDKVSILVSEQDETRSCLWPHLEALKNKWQL